MTRGLSRDQIGVTEEMILAYGERIWELSTNIQVRRGDPVRELDWAQIEAQGHGRGLADVEIADEVGLTRDQVLYIRLVLERRRFRRDHYHRLYELGGGRRFRVERHVPHEDRFGFGAAAMALRKALSFDPEMAAGCLRLGYWNADTVPGWLETRSRERPGHPAVVTGRLTLTYAEVHEQARRLANGLIGLGIRRGDVVAVQLGNSIEFLLGYFAVTMTGAVLCPLPRAARGDVLKAMLPASAARAIIRETASVDRDASGAPEHAVVVTGDAPGRALPLSDLVESSGSGAIEVPPVASDPAFAGFAVSASGQPRAAVHNHHTTLSNCRLVAPLYALDPGDRVLAAVPFSSAPGLAGLNLALHAGATVLLPPGEESGAAARAVEESAPTVLFAGSEAVEAWHAAALLVDGRFSSVRKAAVAGTACSGEAVRALEGATGNGKAGRLWGAAECFIALHTPFDAPGTVRHRTLGTAAPGLAVRIVDPSGVPVPPGTAGEMQLRGCSVFGGYAGDGGSTREAFSPDGWFRTGRAAVADESGNVRMPDRG